MNWDGIVRKLTSRKLWAAVAGFVAAIMLYSGAEPGSAEAIVSIIMAGASVVAYIVGEGLVDAAQKSEPEVLIVYEKDLTE